MASAGTSPDSHYSLCWQGTLLRCEDIAETSLFLNYPPSRVYLIALRSNFTNKRSSSRSSLLTDFQLGDDACRVNQAAG